MNVYDFDKTIYPQDSTANFYKFCLSRYPRLRLGLFKTGWYFFLYFLRVYDKTQCKERFYSFLRSVPDIDAAVAEFWETRFDDLHDWYVNDKRRSDDIIISASPEFLLRPVCDRLGVTLLASRVDKHTGRYDGVNCHGDEKVRRLLEFMPDAKERIEEFYSDSISDSPLARLAQDAYMVKGSDVIPWLIKGY